MQTISFFLQGRVHEIAVTLQLSIVNPKIISEMIGLEKAITFFGILWPYTYTPTALKRNEYINLRAPSFEQL